MQKHLPKEQVHWPWSEHAGQVSRPPEILVESIPGSHFFHPDTGKLLESFWVSVSASDIFMPAWLRGWFSALVFKQKFSQIDGGGFGTSAGGGGEREREKEVYGGGREMKWAFENLKISIENGGSFSLLGLSERQYSCLLILKPHH